LRSPVMLSRGFASTSCAAVVASITDTAPF
jgi:hypothetical protein